MNNNNPNIKNVQAMLQSINEQTVSTHIAKNGKGQFTVSTLITSVGATMTAAQVIDALHGIITNASNTSVSWVIYGDTYQVV
jgi:hypothetical protein